MKNKRILLISIVVLAVLVVACGTVFAVASFSEQQPAEEENNTPTVNLSASEYIREGALAERKVTLSDGKRVELTYKCSSDNLEGVYTDTYIDKNGEEYRFNEKGELVGTNLSSTTYINVIRNMVKGDQKAFESAEKAEEAAREYAKSLYGDVIDGFATVHASLDDQTVEEYLFIFAPTYGEDGFIQGENCFVYILADGTPISCNCPYLGAYDDFDYDSLNDIKKEDVYKYAEEAVVEMYGDGVTSCKVTQVCLITVEGEYKLIMNVEFYIGEWPMAEEVFYDLP